MKQKKRIGDLLKEAGLIDDFQLNSSLAYQKSWGGRLGSIIVRKGFVTEAAMASFISKQFQMPCLALDEIETPPAEVIGLVKAEVAKKFGLFPIANEGKTLVVAVADPSDLKMLDDASFTIGMRIKPVLALDSDIMRAIEVHYDGKQERGKYILPKDKNEGNIYRPEFDGAPKELPVKAVDAIGDTKPRPEAQRQVFSQKEAFEGLVELLISKGIFTKEELMNRIRARIQKT